MNKKQKRIVRKTMNALGLDRVELHIRPNYANSYKWRKPGIEYAYTAFVRMNGKIYEQDIESLSASSKAYGEPSYIYSGVPAVGTASKQDQVVIRAFRAEFAGWTSV